MLTPAQRREYRETTPALRNTSATARVALLLVDKVTLPADLHRHPQQPQRPRPQPPQQPPQQLRQQQHHLPRRPQLLRGHLPPLRLRPQLLLQVGHPVRPRFLRCRLGRVQGLAGLRRTHRRLDPRGSVRQSDSLFAGTREFSRVPAVTTRSIAIYVRGISASPMFSVALERRILSRCRLRNLRFKKKNSVDSLALVR
jgi:hypothetical protein